MVRSNILVQKQKYSEAEYSEALNRQSRKSSTD